MLKHLLITTGDTEFNANLYIEEVPRRLIIGLLENQAFIGNKFKSPFNFLNFNLRDITIYCNGRQYPGSSYNIDYTYNLYVRPYHDMQEFIGMANTTDSNGINYDMYKTGWCLYVFNLTPSMEQSNAFELVREGTTSICLRFNEPVPPGGVFKLKFMTHSFILI